ncbi:Crp/Fnr family transcriptional regulator [Henriciella sp.]|uniref:Crp/Fnr family transcriptional regulator n=1 Tax=Henriciella sp. TaxID=1968823 RepID=UPI0017DB6CF1|nr:Crp/Fnr family transcriptional regulator [Henriciella sp.]HIG24121.1 Crp/Fnr family transcriptional regulator [Henriciella sp.]
MSPGDATFGQWEVADLGRRTINSQNEDICAEADSCLASKLEKLAPLSQAQTELLASLEKEKEELDKGEILVREGERLDELFILKKGWAIATREEMSGHPHIPTVYHPGDIIGLSDAAFESTPNTIVAATGLILCRFPRERLADALRQSPRISGLILALSMIDQAMMNDRLVVSRRTDGYLRLVLFLLQTMSRLRLMEPRLHDQFHCPLTQEQIGAATGLSAVHVSRSVKKLLELDLIERHKRFFRLKNEPALNELVGYVNRYDRLDLSWLPEDR